MYSVTLQLCQNVYAFVKKQGVYKNDSSMQGGETMDFFPAFCMFLIMQCSFALMI